MRKTSLQIKKTKVKGKIYWQVTVPRIGGGRTRRTFKERGEAQTFLDHSKIQQENFGNAAFAITDATRTDATRAKKILDGTGKSLVDAARFLRDHLARVDGGMPIKKAISAFLVQKKAEGSSERHQNDLRTRLDRFQGALSDAATTANVGTTDIDGFLSSLGASAQTCAGYRATLHSFFAWAKSRGHCAENPVSEAMTFKVVPKPPGILSPQEATDLLAVCHPSLLPGVVLGMFCGLRQAEISRLDWRDVDLASGIVTIRADVAKTSSRRTVEIPDNARTWLSLRPKKSGPVWPEGEEPRNLWNLSRIKAGYGPFFSTRAAVNEAQTDPATGNPWENLRPWPANALRHSAISYRLAATRDLPRVATEAGNSPSIVQRHYAEIVKPDAAKKFFAITPNAPANVTAFKGKAA